MGDPHALPSAFDVVVVGTGLQESMVAAAAARVGHSVLHLDANDFYGDAWASFSFQGMQEWMERRNNEQNKEEEVDDSTLLEGETIVKLDHRRSLIRNIKEEWNLRRQPEQEDDGEQRDNVAAEAAVQGGGDEGQEVKKSSDATKDTASQTDKEKAEWTKETLIKNSRHFNLDLTPRLLFSRGDMVELLISSNVSRYTEYKSVSRILTVVDGEEGPLLKCVPSSRSEVFADKSIKNMEKRLLMRYLVQTANLADDSPELADDPTATGTFGDYLRDKMQLTPLLSRFVLNSIAMVADAASVATGLRSTRKFLSSLGRFGSSPFLWQMYGAGELPQAFCRLCAVFGGTYSLGRRTDAVVLDKDGRAVAVMSGGKRIECKNLVLPAHLCQGTSLANRVTHSGSAHRMICLAEESILPSEKEEVTFVSFPAGAASTGHALAQELGPGAGVCPRGIRCLHVTSESNCRDSVHETVSHLTKNSPPLWTMSFDLDLLEPSTSDDDKTNLFVCGGPALELDYDSAVASAKRIFGSMFPEEEFLPRAPEPDEIIIGGGDEEESEVKGDDKVEDVEGSDGGSAVPVEDGEKNKKEDETETEQS